MGSRKEFKGHLKLKLSNGEERRVKVSIKGRSVFLDDYIGPMSEFIVHPSNQRTIDRWVREYEISRNVKVENFEYELYK